MIDYLPSSLRGLMVAAFAAAFMSTIATRLNWGASYLVNDFYRRFVRRDASAPHYVAASRVATALPTGISAAVACPIDARGGGWPHPTLAGGLGPSRRPRPRRAPVGRRPRQPGRLGRRLRTGVRGAVRLGKTAAARDAARRGTARGRRHRGRDHLSRLVATRLADGGGIAARATAPGESGRRPRGRRRGPAPGGSPCSSAWG